MQEELNTTFWKYNKTNEMLLQLDQLRRQQSSNPEPEVLAFPTAEGYGKNTKGGRGGQIIFIDNLNDSGPGSLREALTSEGPRIVIPRVGGNIELLTTIEIWNPYLTFAGHLAPGGGIMITKQGDSDPTTGQRSIAILADEVIFRFIRFRKSTVDERQAENIWINNCKNIIIDHCSFAWASDGNVDITNYYAEPGDIYTSAHTKNITIQYCIFTPPQADGTKNMLISAGPSNITLFSNFIIGATTRNALSNSPDDNSFRHDTWIEYGNNYFINYINGPAFSRNDEVVGGTMNANILNNKAIKYSAKNGTKVIMPPTNPSLIANHRRWLQVNMGLHQPAQIYVEGNITPWRPDETYDEWEVGQYGPSLPSSNQTLIPESFRTYVKHQTPLVTDGVVLLHPDNIFDTLKDKVGAYLPTRDSEDLRAIADAEGGYSTGLDPESLVFPIIANGTPPINTLGDGIPDTWRAANMPNGALYNELAPSGYTWIEEYINQVDN